MDPVIVMVRRNGGRGQSRVRLSERELYESKGYEVRADFLGRIDALELLAAGEGVEVPEIVEDVPDESPAFEESNPLSTTIPADHDDVPAVEVLDRVVELDSLEPDPELPVELKPPSGFLRNLMGNKSKE